MYPALHSVLTLGAIAIVGGFVAVARMAPPPTPVLTTGLRIAAGVELLTALLVIKLVGAPLRPLGLGGEPVLWWATHGPRALVLWAVAEGTAVVGGVFWYLSHDLLLLLAPAAFGIGALLRMRPERLLSPLGGGVRPGFRA